MLVVEEDMNLAKLFSEALEAVHVAVRCARWSGTVRAAAAWQPDLVVLDAGAFEMGGLVALRALRRDSRTSRLPVIVLSGNTERRLTESVWAQGVEDYLPLHGTSPKALARLVRGWLASHRNVSSRTALAI